MTKPIWHSGPPPSVGWWPASAKKYLGVYRWWDGKKWSVAATVSDDAKTADFWAAQKISNDIPIKWQHRPEGWPARSNT